MPTCSLLKKLNSNNNHRLVQRNAIRSNPLKLKPTPSEIQHQPLRSRSLPLSPIHRLIFHSFHSSRNPTSTSTQKHRFPYMLTTQHWLQLAFFLFILIRCFVIISSNTLSNIESYTYQCSPSASLHTVLEPIECHAPHVSDGTRFAWATRRCSLYPA